MMTTLESPEERAVIRRQCLSFRRRFRVPADHDIDIGFDADGDDEQTYVEERGAHRRATASEDKR